MPTNRLSTKYHMWDYTAQTRDIEFLLMKKREDVSAGIDLGLWPDASLSSRIVVPEFSTISRNLTQTWVFIAQLVSKVACLLGDKCEHFTFILFYYGLTREFQGSGRVRILKKRIFQVLRSGGPFPGRPSPERFRPGGGVLFQLVVTHPLTRFIQEVA